MANSTPDLTKCLHCNTAVPSNDQIQVSCDDCHAYICQTCHWCHEYQGNHEIRVCDRCDAFYCRRCDEMDVCSDCLEVVCGSCTTLMSCKFCGVGLCEDCAVCCGRCGIVLCKRDSKFAVECDTCKLSYCLVCLAHGSSANSAPSAKACVRCHARPSKRVEQLVHLRLKSIYKAFKSSSSGGSTATTINTNATSSSNVNSNLNGREQRVHPRPSGTIGGVHHSNNTPPHNHNVSIGGNRYNNDNNSITEEGETTNPNHHDSSYSMYHSPVFEKDHTNTNSNHNNDNNNNSNKLTEAEEQARADAAYAQLLAELDAEEQEQILRNHRHHQSDNNEDLNSVHSHHSSNSHNSSSSSSSSSSNSSSSSSSDDEDTNDKNTLRQLQHCIKSCDVAGIERILDDTRGLPGKAQLRKNAKKALKKLQVSSNANNQNEHEGYRGNEYDENVCSVDIGGNLSEHTSADTATIIAHQLSQPSSKSNQTNTTVTSNSTESQIQRLIPTPSTLLQYNSTTSLTNNNSNSNSSSTSSISGGAVKAKLKLNPLVVGWVIGKRGMKIKDLMSVSGTKVWIDQTTTTIANSTKDEELDMSSYRFVYLQGDAQQVINAVALLVELVATSPSNLLSAEDRAAKALAKQQSQSQQHSANEPNPGKEMNPTVDTTESSAIASHSGNASASSSASMSVSAYPYYSNAVTNNNSSNNTSNAVKTMNSAAYTSAFTTSSTSSQQQQKQQQKQNAGNSNSSNANSQHVRCTISCAPQFVPLLIGKRGWTIQHIQEVSGARVDIDQTEYRASLVNAESSSGKKVLVDPSVVMSGTKASVEHAKRMVEDVLSYPYANLDYKKQQSQQPLSATNSSSTNSIAAATPSAVVIDPAVSESSSALLQQKQGELRVSDKPLALSASAEEDDILFNTLSLSLQEANASSVLSLNQTKANQILTNMSDLMIDSNKIDNDIHNETAADDDSHIFLFPNHSSHQKDLDGMMMFDDNTDEVSDVTGASCYQSVSYNNNNNTNPHQHTIIGDNDISTLASSSQFHSHMTTDPAIMSMSMMAGASSASNNNNRNSNAATYGAVGSASSSNHMNINLQQQHQHHHPHMNHLLLQQHQQQPNHHTPYLNPHPHHQMIHPPHHHTNPVSVSSGPTGGGGGEWQPHIGLQHVWGNPNTTAVGNNNNNNMTNNSATTANPAWNVWGATASPSNSSNLNNNVTSTNTNSTITNASNTSNKDNNSNINVTSDLSLGEFLSHLNLLKYKDILQQNEVDLAVLPLMSEQDLAELGLPKGPRLKILKGLMDWFGVH